jgi:hypothetical protein
MYSSLTTGYSIITFDVDYIGYGDVAALSPQPGSQVAHSRERHGHV